MSLPDSPSNSRYIHSSAFEKHLIIICLAGVAAFYVYHCLYWYDWVMDDAYITFRYAKNLTRGLGLVYNPGERIEGYSNFSWLLLIALGIKSGLSPIMTARGLSILSGIGSLMCSYLIFKSLSPKSPPLARFLPPLLLATNSYFCFWTLSGMETVFFGFLLVLSATLYLKENQQSHPISAYILGLVSLTRPEGIGYVAAFLTVEALLRLWSGKSLTRYYLWFYGVIFLIFSSYLTFKLIYYGSLLPNTYYAKVLFPFQKRSFEYLLDFFSHPNIALLLLFLVSLIMMVQFLERRTLLLISLLAFNWFFIAYVPLDWMPNYRYHVYTLPLLFTLTGLGLTELVRYFHLRGIIPGMITAIVAAMLIYQFMATNITVDKAIYKHKFRLVSKPADWLAQVPDKVREGIFPRLMHIAMFLIENSTREMTVEMSDIGFPGYISNCRIYDWAMLTNKKSRDLFNIIKSDNKEKILNFVTNDLLKDIESYDPVLFLYHPYNPKRWRETRWIDTKNKYAIFWKEWAETMLNDYFNKHMKVIKYDKWLKWMRGERKKKGKKRVYFICYRKKGLTYRPSVSELIQKYEKIVKEYPGYPAFQDRLNELYQQLEWDNNDSGKENI